MVTHALPSGSETVRSQRLRLSPLSRQIPIQVNTNLCLVAASKWSNHWRSSHDHPPTSNVSPEKVTVPVVARAGAANSQVVWPATGNEPVAQLCRTGAVGRSVRSIEAESPACARKAAISSNEPDSEAVGVRTSRQSEASFTLSGSNRPTTVSRLSLA